MSVHYDRARGRWIVRWRDDGRQRARRFADEASAPAFEASLRPPPAVRARAVAQLEARVVDQGGVYAYETAAGTRWRFVFRQSDGSLTTRRGFDEPRRRGRPRGAPPSRRSAAARCARRARPSASSGRSVLEAKRPYVTAGTLQDYATHGRKRLLPWFGELRLAAIDEDRVRDWLAEMAELVDDGELSAKTVNNARTCLSMTLGEAVRRGHTRAQPVPVRARAAGRADRARLPAPGRDRALPRRVRRATTGRSPSS